MSKQDFIDQLEELALMIRTDGADASLAASVAADMLGYFADEPRSTALRNRMTDLSHKAAQLARDCDDGRINTDEGEAGGLDRRTPAEYEADRQQQRRATQQHEDARHAHVD